MRSLLLIHLQNARQSIKSNRLRSFLTMVGITIGVASITTIMALSAGANKIVSTQVDALGGNIAVVRPGAPSQHLDALFRIEAGKIVAINRGDDDMPQAQNLELTVRVQGKDSNKVVLPVE